MEIGELVESTCVSDSRGSGFPYQSRMEFYLQETSHALPLLPPNVSAASSQESYKSREPANMVGEDRGKRLHFKSFRNDDTGGEETAGREFSKRK